MSIMREALNKWNGIKSVSTMRQAVTVETSGMSAVKPEYLPYIERYDKLVKDYHDKGESAVNEFIEEIQKRPYDDFVEFTKANNITISLTRIDEKTGKSSTIANPEVYLRNELPRFLTRSWPRGIIVGDPRHPALYKHEPLFVPVYGKTYRKDIAGNIVEEEVIPWERIPRDSPGIKEPLPRGIVELTPTTRSIPETIDIEARKEKVKAKASFAPETYGKLSPVCEAIPEHVANQMINLAEKSTRIGTEFGTILNYEEGQYGGAFLPDLTLSNIVEGNNLGVEIPRSENTEGTYHTHPWGTPNPSAGDLQDMLNHNDKLMCIGAAGKAGVKIKCFSPNEPVFSQIRAEYNQLATDIHTFNNSVEKFFFPGGKYKQFGIEHTGRPGTRAQGKRLNRVIRDLPNYGTVPAYNSANHQVAVAAADEAEVNALVARLEADELESKAIHIMNLYDKGLDDMLNRKFTSVEDIRFANQSLIPVKKRADEANKIADEAVSTAELYEALSTKLLEAEIMMRPSGIEGQQDLNHLISEYGKLNQRRDALKEKVERQVRLITYPDKFRPGEKNPLMPEGGTWKPEELMLQSCRLMWETLREDLVYETEKGEFITFHPEDL